MVNQLRDAGIGFRYTAEQAARFRQKGWWGDEILLDHLDRWTADAPERELATDGVGRLTYGQARGEAYRLAAELRRMGVQHGDRILAQVPNWNEFVIIYLAAIRAGAVLVPIMPIYRHDEVGYILQRSEAKVAQVEVAIGIGDGAGLAGVEGAVIVLIVEDGAAGQAGLAGLE